MKSKSLLLLPLIFILSGCCKAVFPSVDILIEDSNQNNLLFSATTTDSTWTWNETDAAQYPIEIISTGAGPTLKISLSGIETGQDYLIKVSNTDIDTVNFDYKIKGGNCNMRAEVDYFYYNGNRFEGGKSGSILRAKKY